MLTKLKGKNHPPHFPFSIFMHINTYFNFKIIYPEASTIQKENLWT